MKLPIYCYFCLCMEARLSPLLQVQQARPEHLPRIKQIFSRAKAYMALHGNLHQWQGTYPSDEVLLADITAREFFLCTDPRGTICGCFALKEGAEPTYANIQGDWITHEPYLTLHRLAADGNSKGVAKTAIAYAKSLGKEVRADTHQDNHIMQHILQQSGFRFCGIIRVRDGSPRLAYQLLRTNTIEL